MTDIKIFRNERDSHTLDPDYLYGQGCRPLNTTNCRRGQLRPVYQKVILVEDRYLVYEVGTVGGIQY